MTDTLLKKGQRVELVSCNDPYTTMAPGTRGILLADEPEHPVVCPADWYGRGIHTRRQIPVKWDNGSWLMLVPEAGDALVAVDSVVCPTCGEPGEDARPLQSGFWKCANGHEFEERVMFDKVADLVNPHAPVNAEVTKARKIKAEHDADLAEASRLLATIGGHDS